MAQRPDLPVDGTTITSAWGSTVRQQIVTPFSTSTTRASEIPTTGTSADLVVTGQVTTLTAADNTNGLYIWNGTSWRLPWNAPWGVVAISALPGAANFTSTIGYSSTFTWTAVNRRYYRVTLTGNLENSTVTGVDLSVGQQLTLLFLSVLSAVAVAGIPGGSLPLIAGLLITFGIPPEGIGIVLGVDRVLDMARSMTNVGSDLVTTVVVDAQERKADAA